MPHEDVTVDLTGVVCPFHAATANPQNAERLGAPDQSKPGHRNSLTLLYRHARFHAGMSTVKSVAAMFVGVLGGRALNGVLRNLLTWSYDPAELIGSPLNKEPQNSGMLSRRDPGALDEASLDRLLDEFGSHYVPAGRELEERGLSASEVNTFLDIVAAETNVSDRRRKVGRAFANAEIPILLKVWPSTDVNGVDYLSEATLRTLYGSHLFPALPG